MAFRNGSKGGVEVPCKSQIRVSLELKRGSTDEAEVDSFVRRMPLSVSRALRRWSEALSYA
jgi:hypothetical protein